MPSATPSPLSDPHNGLALAEGRRSLLLLLIVLTVLSAWRLATIAGYDYGMFVDEAQYIDWGREPACGYYSKPPVLAWLLTLAEQVCGETPLCVRGLAVVLYGMASVLLFFAGRRLFDDRVALAAAVLYLCLPGIALTGLFITTDAPLALFTSASTLFAARALIDGRARDWVGLGVCFGLGMMSKYSFALLIAGFLLFLLIAPERRRLLVSGRLWLALAVAGLVFAPNVVWNAQHQFATFSHTADISGLEQASFNPNKLGEYLGGQLLVFGPLSFVALLASPWLRGGVLRSEAGRLLACMSLLPFAAFAVLALASRTLLNWAYVAFAPGIVLVAAMWVRGNYHRWLKWSLGVCLALIIAAQHLPTWTKLAGVELKARQDPYSRTKGWKELGRTVTAVWRTQPGTRILADDRWIMAELLYYVDPAPRNAVMWNPGGPITDHYRLTRDAGSLVGESFLYVTAAADIVALAPYFSRTQLVHQETITTHKESWRVYYLYRLDGFKGY